MTRLSRLATHTRALLLVVALAAALMPIVAAAQPAGGTPQPDAELTAPAAPADVRAELRDAMVALPLAGLLGAALALRPKRKGTPERTPAVIQTQIILALVGSVIMLVVGASLARAFGIVGAASLIRYRSKIEDPKDAGVMLCALAIGLATGVGLYALAVFSTVFMLVVVSIIESFEPKKQKTFELTMKTKDAAAIRGAVEALLRRRRVPFELRSSSNGELSYLVTLPFDQPTDRLSNALLRLEAGDETSVEWHEKGK